MNVCTFFAPDTGMDKLCPSGEQYPGKIAYSGLP